MTMTGQMRAAVSLMALLVMTGMAAGQEPVDAQKAAQDGPKFPGIREESIALAMPVPDPLDHRRMLFDRGISYELNYVFDVLGNSSGGKRRGTVYSGRTEGVIDVDLRKLFKAQEDPNYATTFHANFFHIHGSALTRSYIGNIAPVSNIEAFPSIRLFEAWVQQKFGPLSIRAGQLGGDAETAASSTAGQFNNGTFGWPALNAGNILSGGPAYPLATPGVTVKYDFSDTATKWPLALLFGVYNGDPARAGTEDPQRRNRNGFDFRLRHGALYAAEARYDLNKDGPYAGSYKVGAWGHSGRFDDRRFGTDGLSLADPLSNGSPQRHRGNYGLYAIADQILIAADANKMNQISGFVRAFHSPQKDRNFLAWQLDGGLVAKGLFGRAYDAAGIAVSYMKIARNVRGFDGDFAAFNPGAPVRSHEIAIEANYAYEVRRGFVLQPSVQYVIHPGGRTYNPLTPGNLSPMKNAAVFGLRGVVKY